MKILLTNDDGIYARGLAAMGEYLARNHDVHTIAPLTEQSGISQAITFLLPLFARRLDGGPGQSRIAISGTPVDCVKLALFELCPWKPDVIISGINGGLNAGNNVLYSGTVAAALEGARSGIHSFAVSLEYEDEMHYDAAAEIAGPIIERILASEPKPQVCFNVNIPTLAIHGPREIVIVPMEAISRGSYFVEGQDPKHRKFYWSTHGPAPPKIGPVTTDEYALGEGKITITPLDSDLTCHRTVERIRAIDFGGCWTTSTPNRS
jgi:5'-nucleotidase